MNKAKPNVGFFVSCLVDTTRPQVGFAALDLLEKAGCTVTVPPQSCCAQPAYNNGNRQEAAEIAACTIAQFEALDYLVVPSASCAGMIKYHYPLLFKAHPEMQAKAVRLADKCYELTEFMAKVAQLKTVGTAYNGRIYYHQSCSARREMKATEGERLLRTVEGAEIIDLPHNEACCGFGGLFAVKFDEISNAMVSRKVNQLKGEQTGLLTGLDLGCLMNMAGKLQKEGSKIAGYHIAEVLAGHLDGPSMTG